jgi:hypothetical protein
MFSSLFSESSQPATSTLSAQPTFGALPGPSPASGVPADAQVVCNGAQQRMQAIQSMYSGSFLAYSYVLADSQAQIQQVYNAGFQQGVHHDAGKWHEAKVKNPDSQFAYPQPIYGFSALSDRAKQQKAHLNNLIGAADNAKTQILNLKAHTERIILSELTNCERRNQQLSTQLAKLMLSIELFGLQSCKASVDFARHRELLEKAEKVSQVVTVLQKKISELKVGQRSIESHQSITSSSASDRASGGTSFVTLKESVAKKMDAVYNSVLDRCRAISAQAMHERLSNRSRTFLAELKREYISNDVKLAKLRTMNAFEIEIVKLLSSTISDSNDSFSLINKISRHAESPPLFSDLWQALACICASESKSLSGFLRAAIGFLESKFGDEIASVSSPTGKVLNSLFDKKTALYAFCRQRTTVRPGDLSWIWLAIFCAFRAGWCSVITEIALEKSSLVPGLESVCSLLVKILEGEAEPHVSYAAGEQDDDPYKRLLVSICKGEHQNIGIAQLLPDCTAFDWIWFSLRSVLSSPDIRASLIQFRGKLEALPANYFDNNRSSATVPLLIKSENLGLVASTSAGTSAVHKVVRSVNSSSSKSAVQLALMHLLSLDWGKALRIGFKTCEDIFDINDPFHRFALFATMCLDKFGVLQCVEAERIPSTPSFEPAELILEAALTVALVQERNEYASAVSASSSRKILDQLSRLDKRRNATSSALSSK